MLMGDQVNKHIVEYNGTTGLAGSLNRKAK